MSRQNATNSEIELINIFKRGTTLPTDLAKMILSYLEWPILSLLAFQQPSNLKSTAWIEALGSVTEQHTLIWHYFPNHCILDRHKQLSRLIEEKNIVIYLFKEVDDTLSHYFKQDMLSHLLPWLQRKVVDDYSSLKLPDGDQKQEKKKNEEKQPVNLGLQLLKSALSRIYREVVGTANDISGGVVTFEQKNRHNYTVAFIECANR